MGNICKPQVQLPEENEVNLNKKTEIEEQRKNAIHKQDNVNDQKQDSITDDQKQQQDNQDGQKLRSENNQELKRRENKKMAQIAAVIDQEVIYENIQKQDKVKSPFDYQLLLNAFSNSFIFAQLQGDDKYQKLNIILSKGY
ncbi:unnamed protein product [Paramecium octaurelia]|uniref:Uncharacterized protein n=1 Tax=Paramecium octaurelia TaxID=43137 RepID=A0A8S1VE84_PAROT|nr:unnamed protein product [Paramecium octaurelia]